MRTDQQDRRGSSNKRRSPRKQVSRSAEFEYVYGRNPIREALVGRRRHQRLLVALGVDRRAQDIAELANSIDLPVEQVDRELLDSFAPRSRHGGLLLETSPYPYCDSDTLLETEGPVLLLDHLQDPQNAGTLIRSALAFGVSGVIIPKDRSFQITPAVVSASSGATEAMPISRVTNLSRIAAQAKQSGWWLAGLDNGANATDLSSSSVASPLILVVGSEGSGMTRSLTSQCDYLLRIEQGEAIDSLNAAIAGSIALYTLRTRRA